MLSRVSATASLPDALTVIGSAGSVLGGFVALMFSPHLQREGLESLALGAPSARPAASLPCSSPTF
jgi:hypothetical protein